MPGKQRDSGRNLWAAANALGRIPANGHLKETMARFVKRIDHIALVVEDINKALEFWQDAVGFDLSHMEDVPSEKSMVALLPAQESEVALVPPTSSDSGGPRLR